MFKPCSAILPQIQLTYHIQARCQISSPNANPAHSSIYFSAFFLCFNGIWGKFYRGRSRVVILKGWRHWLNPFDCMIFYCYLYSLLKSTEWKKALLVKVINFVLDCLFCLISQSVSVTSYRAWLQAQKKTNPVWGQSNVQNSFLI